MLQQSCWVYVAPSCRFILFSDVGQDREDRREAKNDKLDASYSSSFRSDTGSSHSGDDNNSSSSLLHLDDSSKSDLDIYFKSAFVRNLYRKPQ